MTKKFNCDHCEDGNLLIEDNECFHCGLTTAELLQEEADFKREMIKDREAEEQYNNLTAKELQEVEK